MTTAEKAPHISFVVASRNDNHGGDLLRRMQLFVSGLLTQCRRFNLASELIIVEWNPPADRPPLAEALKWPAQAGPCEVRIISVPSEVHRRFKYSDKLPLFQMIAKNVGIRRARGQFVLATNIDVLFSDELMRFLANSRLEPDIFYRLDRWDVSTDIPDEAPAEEQLRFCQKNILRVNMRLETVTDPKEIWVAWHFSENGLRNYRGLISYMKSHVPRNFRIPGLGRVGNFLKLCSVWFHRPAEERWGLLVNLEKWKRFFGWAYVILIPQRNCSIDRMVPPANTGEASILPSNIADRSNMAEWLVQLHTNACGDFTLMSRQRWFAICGYPEWEMYSFYIDSVGLYAAYYSGAHQVLLKPSMRLYHIEHAAGWTPEQNDQLYGRMAQAGIPILTNDEYLDYLVKIHTAGQDYASENWGLADLELSETWVGGLDAEKNKSILSTNPVPHLDEYDVVRGDHD